MDPPVYNPTIPYTGHINGGFRPGRLVRVQGKINHNPHSFSINLQCGPSSSHDDVALHVNPRFTESSVIRNSKNYSSWGNEERHGMSFPFVPAQSFEVMIMCDTHQFKVAINGQHFTEYNHRVPVERISTLSIDGDVTVSLIQFEGSNVAGGTGYTPNAPPMMGSASAPYAPSSGGLPPYPPAGGGMPPMGFVAPPYPAPPQSGYPNAGGYPPPNVGGYPPPTASYPPAGYGAPAPGPYPQQPGAYTTPNYPSHAYYGGASYNAYPQPPFAGNGSHSVCPSQPNHSPGAYQQQGYPQHQSKSGGGMLDSAGKMLAGGLAGVGLAKVANKIPGLGGGHGQGIGGYGGGHSGGGHSGGMGGMGGLMGTAAALGIGGAVAGKALKGHKKKNKLLKYGVPLAGVGLGGYALKKGMKGFKHGGHGSSSSSYSSDSD